jgi:TP901 family phage tail tape measure protein
MANTQGDSIGFDSKSFKEFRDALQEITTYLDKMGDQLGRIASSFKDLDFKVRGLADLRELLSLVSGSRGIRNADKFKNIVSAVQDLVKASQLTNSIDASGFKKILSFIKLLNDLTNSRGVSQAQISGLVVSINNFIIQIIAVLQRISKSVADDKSLIQFISLIGGLRSVLKVFSDITTLTVDRKAVDAFALEVTNILNIFQAVAAGTPANAFDSVTKLGRTLTVFANILGGGKGSSSSQLIQIGINAAKFVILVPGLMLMLRGMFILVNLITAIPVALTGGLGDKIDNSIKSFANSMNVMIKSFGGDSKSEVSIGGIARTLAVMIKLGVVVPILFAVMTITFKLVSVLLALVPGNDQLFKLADAFRRVASAFFNFSIALTPKSGGGIIGAIADLVKFAGKVVLLGVVIPVIFTFMAVLFKSIALVVRLIPSTDSLASLSTAFRNIGLAFQNFSESLGGAKGGIITTVGQFVKLGIVIPALFTVMAVVFRAVALILRILPGGEAFITLTEGFKNLGKALESIAAVGSGKTILGVIKSVIALKIVGDQIKALVIGLVKASVFQQVIDFMKSFALLGQGLKNLLAATKDITLGNLVGLVVKMKVIGEVIAATARTVAGADPNSAITLGLVMRNVGQALKNIRLALSVDVGGDSKLLSLLQIIKLIITLKLVLGAVKDIAKSAAPEQLLAAAKLTNSLGKLLTSLYAALATTTLQKVDIKGALSIKDKLNILKDVFKALKDFKGKSLPDFGGTFAALPEFLGKLAAIDLTAKKGDQGIKDKVKILTDSLKELAKIKVNSKQIDTLAKLAGSLGAFATVKSPGKIGDLISGLVIGLSALKVAGFTDKDFKLLAKFVDQIVTSLNNLSKLKTTQDQVAALQALVEALKEINKASSKDTQLTGLGDTLRKSAKVQGTLTGDTLAEGVSEGMLRYNIKVTIIKFLGNLALGILNLFNPITIFGGFRKGAEIVSQFFTTVMDKFAKLKESIAQFGQGIVTLGNKVASTGQSIISSFGVNNILNSPFFTEAANFNKLSTQVKVFGNLTETEVGRLRDLSFQIGKEFPLSASDALTAAKDLIKTGLKEGDVEKALRPIANLAALTDSGDIGIASQGLVQVTNAFKQFTDNIPAGFENISTAGDILSRAADNSTASVESLIEGLANVGPIASSFGLTLETSAAALGIFENAGIRGAEAGTSLKSILTNFTTDRARNEFKRLGVALTDSKGDFRNLNDIITDLNTKFNSTSKISVKLSGATKEQNDQLSAAEKVLASTSRQIFLYQNGLSTGSLDEAKANDKLAQLNQVRQNALDLITNLTGSQTAAQTVLREVTRTQDQNAQSLLNLGGRYGGVGLAALIASGDNGLQAFIDQMNLLPDSATRAQQLLDSFSGDVIQLQGSVSTLATRALEPLLVNFFRPAIQLIRHVVDAFLGLDVATIALASNAAGLFSILATGIGVLLIFVGKVAAVGGAIIEFSSVIFSLQSILFGGVKLLLGFSVGLAGIAITIIPLIALFTALSYVAMTIARIFKDNIGGAGTALTDLFTTISTLAWSAGQAFSGFASVLSGFFGKGSGPSPLDAVGRFFSRTIQGINKKIFAFNVSVYSLGSALELVGGVLRRGGGVLTTEEEKKLQRNPIVAALFGIRGDANSIANIDKIFNSIFVRSNRVKSLMASLSSTFTTFFSRLGKGENFNTVFKDFADGLKSGISGLASEGIGLFGSLFNVDVSALTKQLDQGNLLEAIQSIIQSLGDRVKNFVLGHRAAISDILTSIFRFFFSPGAIIGTIARLLGQNDLANIIDQIGNVFADLFRGVLDFVFNLMSGEDIGTAFRDAFLPIGPKVVGSIRDIIIGAINILGSLLGLDTTTFTDQISLGFQPLIDSFATGDPLKIFGGLGAAVTTLISTAIQLAIGSLGNFFGLDTQTAQDQIKLGFKPLELAFQNGDPSQIFGGIAVAVATLLVTALETAVNSLGSLFNFDTETIFSELFTGFQPLADAILVVDPIRIFGGLISAITGVLGAGLTLALESIGSVLHLDVSTVVASINDSITATSAAVQAGDLAATGAGFLATIASFFAGSIELAFSKIGDLLHIDMSQVVGNINDTLDTNAKLVQTGGPGAPFAVLANTIAGLFASAVDGIFATVGSLLHIDTNDLQKQISDKFGGVIDAINALFVGANGQPSAFQDITIIVSNVVSAIQSLFRIFTPATTAAGAAATKAINPFEILLQFFTTLAGLALDTIAVPLRALKILLDRVASLDPAQTVLLLTTLTALFVAMQIKTAASAAGGLLPLIQSLIPLGGGGGLGIISGLKSLITTASGSVIAKGAALFVIIDFVTNLVRNLTTLEHFDLAGVLGAIVQSFVDLGTDILQAVGIDSLFGVPLDDLKKQFRTTIDQIEIMFRLAGSIISQNFQAGLVDMGLGLADFALGVRILGEQIRENVDVAARAQFDASLKGAQTLGGNGASSFKDYVTNVLLAGVDKGFTDAITGPIVKEQLRVTAQQNIDEITTQFLDDIATLQPNGTQTAAGQAALAQWITALNLVGGVGQAATAAVNAGDFDLFGQIIREATKQGLPSSTFDGIIANIQSSFELALLNGQGGKAFSDANTLLDYLIGNADTLGLDSTKLQVIKDKLAEEFKQIATEAANVGETPITVTPGAVTVLPAPPTKKVDNGKSILTSSFLTNSDGSIQVTPDVEVKVGGEGGGLITTTTDPTQVKDSITTSVQGGTVPLVITPDATVEPNLNITDSTQADEFTAALARLQEVIPPTQLLIQALTTDTTALSTSVGGLDTTSLQVDTDMVTAFTDILTAWIPLADVIKPDLEYMAQQITALANGFVTWYTILILFTPLIIQKITDIKLATIDFTTTALSSFVKLNEEFIAVNTNLGNILAKIDAVKKSGVPTTNADGSITYTYAGGGQSGITVHPDKLYQVTETGAPELLSMNGKTYLLPGSGGTGQVIPAINASSISGGAINTQNTRLKPGGQVGSGGDIVYNEGDMILTINVPNGNPQAIAAAVRTEVAKQKSADQTKIKDRLRNAGR